MRLNTVAVNHYLQRTDYENGLKLSIEARDLAAVGKAIPGRKTAENAYDAYVEIGIILTEKADVQIIESEVLSAHS